MPARSVGFVICSPSDTPSAISSAVERLLHTQEVTGSNPVSRTTSLSDHGDLSLRDHPCESGRGAHDLRGSAEHEGCAPHETSRNGRPRTTGDHRRVRICLQGGILSRSPATPGFRRRLRVRVRLSLRGAYCSTLRSASASCAERSALRNFGSSGRHIWKVVWESQRDSPSLTERPMTWPPLLLSSLRKWK